MKVAVIGATGFVGTQVVRELENRGYSVDAIVRDTTKVEQKENVVAKSIDVNNIDTQTVTFPCNTCFFRNVGIHRML